MIDRISHVGQKYEMKINASKTKLMQFSRKYGSEIKLTIGKSEIENKEEFPYLGALICMNCVEILL